MFVTPGTAALFNAGASLVAIAEELKALCNFVGFAPMPKETIGTGLLSVDGEVGRFSSGRALGAASAVTSDEPRISAKAAVGSVELGVAVGITISVFTVAEAKLPPPTAIALGSMGIGLIRTERSDCIRVAKC